MGGMLGVSAACYAESIAISLSLHQNRKTFQLHGTSREVYVIVSKRRSMDASV